MGLFGGEDKTMEAPVLHPIDDWEKMDRLKEEFEATGLYLSGHPLDDHGSVLKRLNTKTASEVMASGKGGMRKMAGILMEISERTSQKGNRYAFLKFMDMSGVFEAIAFSELLTENRSTLVVGNSFFIQAQFDEEKGRFSVHGLSSLEGAAENIAPGMMVTVATAQPLAALNDILSGQGHGRGHVRVITYMDEGLEAELELRGSYNVTPDVLNTVRDIPGVIDAQEI